MSWFLPRRHHMFLNEGKEKVFFWDQTFLLKSFGAIERKAHLFVLQSLLGYDDYLFSAIINKMLQFNLQHKERDALMLAWVILIAEGWRW